VKAKAGLGRLDSPWSNVAKLEPPPLPLPAPKLEQPSTQLFMSKFNWSAVAGAAGYTLQIGGDEDFSQPEDVYDGEKTEFTQHTGLFGPLSLAGLSGLTPSITAALRAGGGTRFYRVKARAGPGRLDSFWSNVVKVDPPRPLPAPELKRASRQLIGSTLTWTAIEGAAGYRLQASADETFARAEDLYTGPKTEFRDLGSSMWIGTAVPLGGRHYRVQATAAPGSLDSPWSNVVSAD
jgi:hypothetical protein